MSRPKLILLAMTITVMASCVSVKKQRSRAEEFYRAHPEELAEKCASNFTPTYKQGKEVEGKRDTVYMPGDTVQCPPIVNKQTGEKTPGKKISCPPGKTIYVPKLRVDTVESPALLARNAALVTANASLRGNLESKTKAEAEALKKANSQAWQIRGLILALLIAIGYIVKKIFS